MAPGLLAALAVALTGAAAVGPVLLVTALLTSRGGRASASGFLAGYVGMYTAIGMAIVAARLDPLRWASGEGGPAGAMAAVAIGSVMAAVGLWTVLRPGAEVAPTGARRAPPMLDRASPLGAFGLGLAVASVNVKNLVLYLTAVAVLQASDLPAAGKLAAVPLVAAVFGSAAFVPLGIHLAAPERAGRLLAALRRAIEQRGRRIGAGVLLVLGLVLAARGLRVLA